MSNAVSLLTLSKLNGYQSTILRRIAKKSLVVAISLGLVNTTVAQTIDSLHQNWSSTLPQTDDSGGLIDKQQSQQIGEWALRQINHDAPLINDPWLQQSLETIVWQINSVARADAPMALVLINDQQINAFAVPAGLIGINVGLINKANNLDEVVSVISHEIAHVSQRHYQHRNDEKTKQLLMQIGGMAAGIAAAKSGDGNATAAVMMGTQAMSANSMASFSRDQEREADRMGMQIMAQAGYDVNAMPNFFATLDQQNPVQKNAFIPSFVMSHPLTSERLSEARQRASTYPKSTKMIDKTAQKQLFDKIQWRAKYLANLTNINELIQASRNNDGAKLALAMYYIDQRQFTQAKASLQPFANDIEQLRDPLAVVVSATLDTRQSNYQQAIDKLTRLSNLMPERRDIKLYLADIYLQSPTDNLNNAKAVLQLLQPLAKQYPKDVMIWQKLEQASQVLAKNSVNNNNEQTTLQKINLLRYRANREFWQNNLVNAVTSLSQAKTLAKNLKQNTAILALINAQLEQVQQANQVKNP